jgi:hypothetical protein
MNVEEAIMAFGDTAVWVECDVCGRAFGRPGLNKAIVAVEGTNVCVDCLCRSRGKWGTSTEGGCRGPQSQVGVGPVNRSEQGVVCSFFAVVSDV